MGPVNAQGRLGRRQGQPRGRSRRQRRPEAARTPVTPDLSGSFETHVDVLVDVGGTDVAGGAETARPSTWGQCGMTHLLTSEHHDDAQES